MDRVMILIRAWARSRRGVVAIVLSVLTVAGSTKSVAALATAPLRLVVAVAVSSLLVTLAAKFWEGRTWPETPPYARSRQSQGRSNQLREDLNARLFTDHGGFLFERRNFVVASGLPPAQLTAGFVATVTAESRRQPAPLVTDGVRTWWLWDGNFYWENCGYDADDVAALVRDRIRRRERELERAHTLLRAESAPVNRRGIITREMRRAVFARDGGVCVDCGSNFDLQYDHVLPVAHGGATTVDNLQLLCSYCNQSKGASI